MKSPFYKKVTYFFAIWGIISSVFACCILVYGYYLTSGPRSISGKDYFGVNFYISEIINDYESSIGQKIDVSFKTHLSNHKFILKEEISIKSELSLSDISHIWGKLEKLLSKREKDRYLPIMLTFALKRENAQVLAKPLESREPSTVIISYID